MYDAIRQPGHDAKEGAGVRRKDIAEVGSIEDVLESGQDPNPDRWPPAAGDESARFVSTVFSF